MVYLISYVEHLCRAAANDFNFLINLPVNQRIVLSVKYYNNSEECLFVSSSILKLTMKSTHMLSKYQRLQRCVLYFQY